MICWSIFDWFWVDMGVENRPKIDQKSIQKLILFLISFYKAKVAQEAHLGTPPTLNFVGGAIVFEGFLLFDKITFLTKLGPSWLHFGRCWNPFLGFFGDQKSIKKMINFWIVFLSILEPSWRPKWFQNPSKSFPGSDPEGSWSPFGTPRCPKKAQEAPEASKSDLRDLIFDDFGRLFKFFKTVSWLFSKF